MLLRAYSINKIITMSVAHHIIMTGIIREIRVITLCIVELTQIVDTLLAHVTNADVRLRAGSPPQLLLRRPAGCQGLEMPPRTSTSHLA